MPPVLISARAAAHLLTDWRASTDAPAYEALADALRVLVIDGRVAQGVRLPAERGLAAALGVSRTTVANAYARLRSDGFLVSVRGSGSVVHLPRDLVGRPDPERLGGVVEGDLLDLRKAALHAAPGIDEAVERAVRHVPAALAGIGYDTVGDPGLRAAIAARYTERGLPTDTRAIPLTEEAAYAETISLLSLADPPTALFAGHDELALGALRASAERGLGPEEFSVVGYDDVPIASHPLIGLTTIDQFGEEMGFLAASLVLERISGRTRPVLRQTDPVLRARRSSARISSTSATQAAGAD